MRASLGRHAIALGMVALVASGCSTSKDDIGASAEAPIDAATLAGEGPPDPSPGGSPTAGAAQASDGTAAAAASSAGASPGSAAPPSAGSGAAPAASGVPADATPVRVGIGWVNVDVLVATFGDPSRLDDAATGTSREAAAPVVDWINRNGGINGHPIEPYYYEFPISEFVAPGGPERAEQGMCEHFKEKGVTLAVPLVSIAGVFNGCAHDAGMVTVATGNADEVIDTRRFAEIGANHYRPNWLVGERRERLLVPLFQRIGFFTDARVGLMIEDTPASRRVATTSLLPALDAIDADVVRTTHYDPGSTDFQAHVLQMQSAGATHVFFGGCGCGGTQAGYFMSAAQNQGYHPTYGLATDMYLNAIIATGAPREQVANVVGLGWAPFQDTGGQLYDEGEPINDSDATCRRIWHDSGMSQKQQLTVMALYCEAAFFLQRAYAGAPDLDPATLRNVVETKGFRFESPTAGPAAFGADHHDGVTTVRAVAYDEACDCFLHHGPLLPLGEA